MALELRSQRDIHTREGDVAIKPSDQNVTHPFVNGPLYVYVSALDCHAV